jgi:hypothetical protein
MTYKLSTKGNKLEISLTKNELVTEVDKLEYSVSLARTGGQGSKGDSVTNAFINADEELILEVTSSGGQVTQINAGNILTNVALHDLSDVSLLHLQEGDYLAYDLSTQTFGNHQLTTSKLADIDNNSRSDGSVLVYNGLSAKYTATNQLNNPNTLIVGGNF